MYVAEKKRENKRETKDITEPCAKWNKGQHQCHEEQIVDLFSKVQTKFSDLIFFFWAGIAG